MEKSVENWEVYTTIGEQNIPNETVMQTKDQIEAITELKNKIIAEIESSNVPDLAFLSSKEVLGILPELLVELLDERKALHEAFITKPFEEITFDDFVDFSRLSYIYSILNHIDNVAKSDTTEKIIEDFQPLYTAFNSEVKFSVPYYERVVYALEHLTLNADQKRILEINKEYFELEGINLFPEVQEEIKAIDVKLAKLSTDFTNNIVKSKKKFSYQILDIEVIKDLPEATLDAAKKKALQEGKNGYLFDADPTAYWDILMYCSDSNIRKDFAQAKNAFATDWEFDNRPLILEIIQLKDKKAKLMGYKNFAELSLAQKMAKKPEVVIELLDGITQKAKQKALTDIEEIKDYYQISTIDYWDIIFYETKIQEEKYALNEKELKKYFEYDNIKTYLFNFVKNFYWLELKEIKVPTYSEDVSVFEVYKNWKLVSYYLLDPFYRDSKSPGAWADNTRERFGEKIPLIVNVCNFQKQEPWKNILSMRDVETLFHEFGHALHEMLSQSPYSDLSGFGVEWDFVELPSQIHENWVNNKESITQLGRHYETGEAIPEEILSSLEKLKTFMSWANILGQNTYALLDMILYSNTPPTSIEELDKKALELSNAHTIFPKGPEFKMYASFGHIFWGWYAAGYYSYIRAEILEADVFAKIKEMWMFERATGEKFIATILWQWSRKPAWELFADFMWRELSSEAFMKRKGLV